MEKQNEVNKMNIKIYSLFTLCVLFADIEKVT